MKDGPQWNIQKQEKQMQQCLSGRIKTGADRKMKECFLPPSEDGDTTPHKQPYIYLSAGGVKKQWFRQRILQNTISTWCWHECEFISTLFSFIPPGFKCDQHNELLNLERHWNQLPAEYSHMSSDCYLYREHAGILRLVVVKHVIFFI